KAVIGKPATVDTSAGEGMHFRVRKTRRPRRGGNMKSGSAKKAVLVKASRIRVRGKWKGSGAGLHDISEMTRLTTAREQAKQMIRDLGATSTFDDIIGNSSELMIAIEQARIGARTPANVLLRGPSGSGKELFAQAIHHESNQKFYK